MRTGRFWMIFAALALVAPTLSCNGDDGGGRIIKPPTPVVLDVEPGTWRVVGKLTPATQGCLSFQDIVQPQNRYCDGIDVTQQAKSLGLECTFTMNGDQVQGTCQGSLSESISYTGSVAGGVGSNGRSVDMGGQVEVTIGSGNNPQICRYVVTITGTWISPEGCGTTAAGQ